MCCFSKKVDVVADTNIFARSAKDGRQFLVYSMRFKAGEDLAMILPIPTPKGSPDDAVKFLNLEKYAAFFEELHKGFPVLPTGSRRPPQLWPATPASGGHSARRRGSGQLTGDRPGAEGHRLRP